jgi:hypothetical protein
VHRIVLEQIRSLVGVVYVVGGDDFKKPFTVIFMQGSKGKPAYPAESVDGDTRFCHGFHSSIGFV